MPQEARLGSRAERTRGAVMAAAEELFAERGFDATRLEDVAERVGIRRASIVYYFKDKRELYDAVLDDVYGGLLERVEAALSSREPLAARVEAGVSAWVDYVGERPSIARLVLREAADARPGHRTAVARHAQPFADLIRRQVFERGELRGARFTPIDPVHLSSAIAGATVFFVAAMPALLPDLRLDPTSPEHLAAHREEVLRILRRLLGIRARRSARG